jgi:hypothetical protein
MPESPWMREWLITECRRLTLRKVVLASVAIVIVVALAYGNNIGNASAHLLLRAR